MKRFSDRIAFVTGGASRIGYGLIQNFLKLGIKVVVDFDPDYLREVREESPGGVSIYGFLGRLEDAERAKERLLRVAGHMNFRDCDIHLDPKLSARFWEGHEKAGLV
jgi:NAD(P)-dependent dehydrogenase (short-subunit alcohol dehydrogenase family)